MCDPRHLPRVVTVTERDAKVKQSGIDLTAHLALRLSAIFRASVVCTLCR